MERCGNNTSKYLEVELHTDILVECTEIRTKILWSQLIGVQP